MINPMVMESHDAACWFPLETDWFDGNEDDCDCGCKDEEGVDDDCEEDEGSDEDNCNEDEDDEHKNDDDDGST